MEYRYKQLNFRVTDSEYEIIQKKMKLSGIKKPTAYIRKMAMDGYVIRLDLSELTEIKEEVEVCMMIKDSIDDEKVSRQKQFDRFCYYLGGIKQLLDKKAAQAAGILQIICYGMYTYITGLHS